MVYSPGHKAISAATTFHGLNRRNLFSDQGSGLFSGGAFDWAIVDRGASGLEVFCAAFRLDCFLLLLDMNLCLRDPLQSIMLPVLHLDPLL
jgi:hypothetical protein